MTEIDYIKEIENYFNNMEYHKNIILKAVNHEKGFFHDFNPHKFFAYQAMYQIKLNTKKFIADIRCLRDKIENG